MITGGAGAASTPAFYGRVFNQIFNFIFAGSPSPCADTDSQANASETSITSRLSVDVSRQPVS